MRTGDESLAHLAGPRLPALHVEPIFRITDFMKEGTRKFRRIENENGRCRRPPRVRFARCYGPQDAHFL